MPFVSERPAFRRVAGDGEFELLEPMVYQGARDRFEIPAGFVVTDLNSIPWFAQWLFSKVGPWYRASLVHDWLYAWQPDVSPYRVIQPSTTAHGSRSFARRVGTPLTRKDADGVFLRILREEGVGWWRRHTMHKAVRLGGAKAWAHNRARLAAESAPR